MDVPVVTRDPILTPVPYCHRCGSTMSGYSIYQGQGVPWRAHLRGAIVQKCSKTNDPQCYVTEFLTPPYVHEDAQNLLRRLLNPALGNSGLLRLSTRTPSASPQSHRSSTQQPAAQQFQSHGPPIPQPGFSQHPPPSQPQPSQAGSTPCSNPSCLSSGGTKRKANIACAQTFCHTCCENAALQAMEDRVYRAPCPVARHRKNIQPQATPPPQNPPPSLQLNDRAPRWDERRTQLPPNHLPGSSAAVNLDAPASVAPAPSHSGQKRAQPLSIPVGVEWEARYKAAVNMADVEKSRKAVQQELTWLQRSTLKAIIYYAPNKPYISFDCPIDHWPRVQLQQIPVIMRDLKLQDGSLIDIYRGADQGWITVTPRGVIEVEAGRPLIMRKRESIMEGIEPEDCPGLDDCLRLYDNGHRKRSGPELVSPLKKASKHESNRSGPLQQSLESTSSTSVSQDAGAQTVTVQRLPGLQIVEAPATGPQRSPPLPKPHPSLQPPSALCTAVGNAVVNAQAPQERILLNGHNVLTFKALERTVSTPGGPVPMYPHDFAVCDVVDGNKELERLKDQLRIPQHKAFSNVFQDANYKKATLNKHRKLWMSAPGNLQTRYLNRGRTMRGSWKRFLNSLKQMEDGGDDDEDIEVFVEGDAGWKGGPHPSEGVSGEGQGTGGLELVPEDDSGLISDEDVDHSQLCPFCDQRMPTTLSASLRAELEDLIRQSVLKPSIHNQYHRVTYTFVSFIGFCQKHRHEAEELPKAAAMGWDVDIDFNALPGRIQAMKSELEDIFDDPEASSFFALAKTAHGPKSGGAMGSLQVFGRQGAAYYGERGFHAIVDALRSMFQEGKVATEHLKPLSLYQFIEEVLLPEAAVLLIMEDKGVSFDNAKQIHSDSRAFGIIHRPGVDDAPDTVVVKQEPVDTAVPSQGPPGIVDGLQPSESIFIDLTDCDD